MVSAAMLRIRHLYYEQFDADHARDVPAEGYGGWKSGEIEVAPAHTALVVMHAWDCGTFEQYPGWWRCCDEIPRAYRVCREVFPGLLSAVRASEFRLFHVVAEAPYYKHYPGYRRAAALAGPPPSPPARVEADPAYRAIRQFRHDHVFPGRHNADDCAAGWSRVDFPPEARPQGDEGIAEDGRQLLALCREAGVNHLVYAGFNIDWCLLMSAGGMLEMSRHGLICSALRGAVTAVENRETARCELVREIGLWRVSVNFGCVFEVGDFIAAAGRSSPAPADRTGGSTGMGERERRL